MRFLPCALPVLALLVLAPPTSPASPPQDGGDSADSTDLPDLLARLEGSDPQEVRRAWSRLRDGGDPARRRAVTRSLLEGFAARAPRARHLGAALLADLAGAEDLPRVVELLGDPDPRVRLALLPLFARPDLSGEGIVLRASTLATLARGDPDPLVRRGAVKELGTLDHPAALGEMATLIRELPTDEGRLVAESLPASPRSASLVRTLVANGFTPERPSLRTPDPILAAVLPLHGRLMADSEGGGEGPTDRAALVLGLRHPSPQVRRGAAQAFEGLLARLRELGEGERALRVLAGLARQGLDPALVHFHRARLAFVPAADPATAREAARALRGGGDLQAGGAHLAARAAGAPGEARLWLFRSLYLEAMADLALGEPRTAGQGFRRAGQVLDASLSERGDLSHEGAQWAHVDALHRRALVEIAQALAALAEGRGAGDRDLLEGLYRAHLFCLEAQVLTARLAGEALTGWDALLDAELSPFRLILTGLAYPGLDPARAIELQRSLGRALATVAPREMPGFAPLDPPPAGIDPALTDPLADERRLDLLRQVQLARLDGVVERIAELNTRIARRGGTGWELPEREIEELELLDRRRQILERELQRSRREGDAVLGELRIPGSQALWLARDLRNEGHGAESRQVARRMKADLERTGISNWWYYLGTERLVRADLIIGSAYTDDDEPLRAQEALEAAVERLEGIERRMLENGARERDLEGFRALLSNALVSLAVNSNVKLGRPEEALAYYERAYALRQDEFMRVLLAVYRARSGREAEARDLLREVRAGPQTWYNMACAHALLGDTTRALELLEIELRENHSSESSRRRQEDWAAGDPDLASLRGDPRFEGLVGR